MIGYKDNRKVIFGPIMKLFFFVTMRLSRLIISYFTIVFINREMFSTKRKFEILTKNSTTKHQNVLQNNFFTEDNKQMVRIGRKN